MELKERKTVLLLIAGFLFFSFNIRSLANINIDGTLMAELNSDILFLDLSSIGIDSRRSSDRGSTVRPSFYPLEFTKLNVNLSFKNQGVDAFVPLTFGVDSQAQLYLIAEDYLNIPYYISMQSDPFYYCLSSSPVGNFLMGFVNMQDRLGIGWKPNSSQPILTFKAGINTGKFDSIGYIILDQKVEGLPCWELLPIGEGMVGDEQLGGKSVKEYGLIDEIAQYNYLKFGTAGNRFKYNLIYGQKFVENPDFRIYSPDKTDSISVTLQNWAYLKENMGIDFACKLDRLNLSGAFFIGKVNWRKYEEKQVAEDALSFYRRWYPYDTRGELTGMALNLFAEFNDAEFEAWFIEPTFQAVGAVNGQFSVISRFVPKSEMESTVERRSCAIFDPVGEFTKSSLSSSPAVDYLGRSVIRSVINKRGKIGPYEVALKAQMKKVDGLYEFYDLYVDPRNGSRIIKDNHEFMVKLAYDSSNVLFNVVGVNRNYKDYDYHRSIETRYEGSLNNFLLLGNCNKIWRLRDDDGLGEGSAFFANFVLQQKIKEGSVIEISTDFRTGNYDYDLLNPYSDKVVLPYTFLRNKVYVERKTCFSSRKGKNEIILAGEVITQKSNFDGVESGSSLVGCVGISLPWTANLESNIMYLGVNGLNNQYFPSGFLKSTLHTDIAYNEDDFSLQLGITMRPNRVSNVYISLTNEIGIGKLSLGYGRETLLSFSDSDVNLPGMLRQENAYWYTPAPALYNRPWETWANYNFYSLWENKLRSTEETWKNFFTVKYWFEF